MPSHGRFRAGGRARSVALVVMLLSQTLLMGHETYRSAMDRLAGELRTRITEHGLENLLVDRWERVDGIDCELGNFLALDLEAALANGVRDFKLLNRHNLDALKSEHKLEMAGLVDEAQRIREAGKLLKADAIIFGYYSYTGDLLVLRTKTVDLETSEQLVVQAMACLPDALIHGLCGGLADGGLDLHSAGEVVLAMNGSTGPSAHTAHDAFMECEMKRLGTYCFRNNGRKDIDVYAHFPTKSGDAQVTLSVPGGSTECFFGRPSGEHEFLIYELAPSYQGAVVPRLATHGVMRSPSCGVGLVSYP
jgi:hypothetical protein